MEFRLTYRGRLPANGSVVEKQAIRRVFHGQLAELWRREPLRSLADPKGNNVLSPVPAPGQISLIFPLGPFQFTPLVTQRLNLICRLNILFLRPQDPGILIGHGGDLDNRLKTLLDALRIPQDPPEIPKGDQPRASETPFFCLLEDDALIADLSVTTDRLLEPSDPQDVSLVIHVWMRATIATWISIGLGG